MDRLTKTSVALLAMGLLVSCGNSGPSKSDVEKLLNQAEAQELANRNAVMGMIGQKPIAAVHIAVDNLSCTAEQDNIYKCLVTESANGNSHAITLELAKSNGAWVPVND